VYVDHDAEFIDALVRSNVAIRSRDGAILLCHQICDLIEAGVDWHILLQQPSLRPIPPLTPVSAFKVITAAAKNYCPQYNSKIEGR
jgi:uncharacterized protein DUF732